MKTLLAILFSVALFAAPAQACDPSAVMGFAYAPQQFSAYSQPVCQQQYVQPFAAYSQPFVQQYAVQQFAQPVYGFSQFVGHHGGQFRGFNGGRQQVIINQNRGFRGSNFRSFNGGGNGAVIINNNRGFFGRNRQQIIIAR